MPNARYTAGVRFERQVRDMYQDAGWAAIRAAGSHGAADVWAAKAWMLNLVACKVHGRISKTERMNLVNWAGIASAVPVIASRPKPGAIRLEHAVTGEEVKP